MDQNKWQSVSIGPEADLIAIGKSFAVPGICSHIIYRIGHEARQQTVVAAGSAAIACKIIIDGRVGYSAPAYTPLGDRTAARNGHITSRVCCVGIDASHRQCSYRWQNGAVCVARRACILEYFLFAVENPGEVFGIHPHIVGGGML